MQGQCKANAMELAPIAEPQPVLAFSNAKVLQRKMALSLFDASQSLFDAI
jgi:hypothetical protein